MDNSRHTESDCKFSGACFIFKKRLFNIRNIESTQIVSDDDPNEQLNKTETIFVKLSGDRKYDMQIEHFDDMLTDVSVQSSWAGLDSYLIDDDFLLLEPEEADKIYAELKKRQLRRSNMEEKEQVLLDRMKELEAIAHLN